MRDSLWTREEVAASVGVPVEWVPEDFADLSDEEVVERIEARRDAETALMRSPLAALLRPR